MPIAAAVLAESCRVFAAVADLVLPAFCAGRGGPGCAGLGPLCAACGAPLEAPARLTRPRPCPPGLPPTWAVAGYAGPVRAALAAYKEHGSRALAGPLGAALARAVTAAAGATGPTGAPVLLVPVPSTRAAVRALSHPSRPGTTATFSATV